MKSIYNTQQVAAKWKHYRHYLTLACDAVQKELNLENRDLSVSIILLEDAQMQVMNRQYRQKDYPTDVLSFPDTIEADYLGDIFINVDALVRQAQSYGHSLKREFCFLVVHGLLHLCGYDHHTTAEEIEMFELQERILAPIVPRK